MIEKEKTAERLKEFTAGENIRTDVEMKDHTTFRTGGSADVFVTPQSITEAAEIVRFLLNEKIPYTVIGNGSNILVSDRGYRGCIVCMGHGTDDIKIEGDKVTAGAGAILSKVAYAAYEKGLTGLEFASGIPGSLGGAVVMNAGAYGGEMKDVVSTVTLFDTKTSGTVTLTCDQMGFGYRKSIVRPGYVVLEAVLKLSEGDRTEIKSTMDDLATRRRQKQPLEFPSAGSTFKRPEECFAGKLIEDSGLKGYCIGGAKVSEKHCGFVINTGTATTDDIIGLMKHIRKTVNERFNVMLESEVVLIGEDIGL